MNNLQAHRKVLQIKCYEFEKPEFPRKVVGELVGIGLLFTEGEKHKKARDIRREDEIALLSKEHVTSLHDP